MKHEKTITVVFNVCGKPGWYLLWAAYAYIMLLKLGLMLQEPSVCPCVGMCDTKNISGFGV